VAFRKKPRAPLRATSDAAASKPMIAITTSISTNVKPARPVLASHWALLKLLRIFIPVSKPAVALKFVIKAASILQFHALKRPQRKKLKQSPFPPLSTLFYLY
jgi:hypothetical protein